MNDQLIAIIMIKQDASVGSVKNENIESVMIKKTTSALVSTDFTAIKANESKVVKTGNDIDGNKGGANGNFKIITSSIETCDVLYRMKK